MAMIHFETFARSCISVVYTVIIYMLVTNFYCTPTEGVKIQYSKYFDGDELVTIYKISLQRCICECNAKKPRCLSLIYKRTFTSCRLNVEKATSMEALEDKPGSIYVEMDEDIYECDKYYSAAQTDDSVVPFNHPACGKPQAKANATVLGNVYSNGSRIKYVCNEGFKQLDQTEAVTVCLYNESWSEINFTCKPDTFGKSCKTDSECLEQSSECREHICVCIPNHAYSLTEYGCVLSSHLGCDNSLISDPQTIPDDHFTASSKFSNQNESTCFPFRARFSLDYPDNATYCGAWAAATESQNKEQYIQVNLSQMHSVRKIKTQGRTYVLQYVKSYKVKFSTDGSVFQTVQNSTAHGDLIFPGNNGSNMTVTNELPCPIEAVYMQINPQDYVKHMSLRFDLIGCTPDSADCDFENGTCGWQHINTSLKTWERGLLNNLQLQSVPPSNHNCSRGTNSTGAMNCSCIYITSDQQKHGNAQIMQTIRRSNVSRCLKLWHAASADFAGSLNVITTKCEHGIEKLRNTTIGNYDKWIMSTVRIESGVYQIVIEGVWTSTSLGYLAIDDINLSDNDCP